MVMKNGFSFQKCMIDETIKNKNNKDHGGQHRYRSVQVKQTFFLK